VILHDVLSVQRQAMAQEAPMQRESTWRTR
jgi:hypothetical protein